MSLIYCDVSAECKYRLWMTSCLINANSTDCLTCMNFVKGYTLSSSGQTCEFCSSITLQHEALMHWAITRCLGPRGLNSHSLRRWRSPSEISPCRIPFTKAPASTHAHCEQVEETHQEHSRLTLRSSTCWFASGAVHRADWTCWFLQKALIVFNMSVRGSWCLHQLPKESRRAGEQ